MYVMWYHVEFTGGSPTSKNNNKKRKKRITMSKYWGEKQIIGAPHPQGYIGKDPEVDRVD